MFAVVILLYLLYLFSFLLIANRFIYVMKFQRPINYYVYVLFIALSLFSIIAFIGRRHEHDFFALITPLSYIVMGVWALIISFGVLNELINLIALFLNIKNFRYYSTFITMCLCILASAWSLLNCSLIQRTTNISIPVPHLSEPLTIVQLSDLHISASTHPVFIKRIFNKTMAQNPDIIVLTGDILDSDILKDNLYIQFDFDSLRAPHGVYAVTGNHDHYTGAEVFYELMRRSNITVLRDDSLLVDNIINIAGINDVSFRSEEMITIALAGVDKNYPVLFLSHRPESFDHAASAGLNLVQLSGHTHGGQIPPIELTRRFIMKYNVGVYKKNNAAMYVSAGTRWWGPSMRFGNFCEIAVITLYAADD